MHARQSEATTASLDRHTVDDHSDMPRSRWDQLRRDIDRPARRKESNGSRLSSDGQTDWSEHSGEEK